VTATLDRKEWETFVTDVQCYEQDLSPGVPMIAASGPDWFSSEPPPTVMAHYCTATVQLNRRDGSPVVAMGPDQRFRIGRDDFRVLEVLHRDGPCVVLRCALRPVPEVQA
jgi:hypothetical protein